jgi:hypothetical protein
MATPSKYRLDRTAFKIQTFEEANNHYRFWKNKSYSERLDAAFFLINTVYNTSPFTRLNRTVFSKRKHD